MTVKRETYKIRTFMAFELQKVVPWGRNLNEYKSMFKISVPDLDKKIISFGDGPASFNYEMNKLGKKIISIDPVYQFTKEQLNKRIEETKEVVLKKRMLEITDE